MAKRIDDETGLAAVRSWREGGAQRAEIAAAVRWTLGRLAERAPGRSVEVRVPPFGAVQCVAGPVHRRGTPPAVIEADPQVWLALAVGDRSWADALADGSLRVSGQRADLSAQLPLV